MSTVRAFEFALRFDKNCSCASQRTQILFTREFAFVVDDDVALAADDRRLVDREARVLTYLHFPSVLGSFADDNLREALALPPRLE
jgi:hypothetical protein